MIHPKRTCSGCGQIIPSVNPDKWYQICSTECREIVQDTCDDLIDERHAITTQSVWMQKLIDKEQKSNFTKYKFKCQYKDEDGNCPDCFKNNLCLKIPIK